MTAMFIGCATDRNFVEPTCAMLSSLDDNGEVPEATILVAAFGLEAEDRQLLQASAGRLGGAMQFVHIAPDSPKIVALPEFSLPLPLLGRLILPGEIDARGARLLLIDSDMIVNASVRPLFDMDMHGRPLAAVLDPITEPELLKRGRKLDPDYFNAGLMLLNLDVFNARSIGERSMRWLAACLDRPEWLDQDALNHVIGSDWIRLGREWNFFFAGEPWNFTLEDYESSRIVHFAAAKPWHYREHVAAPIYFRHAARAERKAFWRRMINKTPVDRDFIATTYEVLLGRELDSEDVLRDRISWPATEVLVSVLGSDEFAQSVMRPIKTGEPFSDHLFKHRLSLRHRYWVQDRLPILPETALAVQKAASWRDVLSSLVGDARLMSLLA